MATFLRKMEKMKEIECEVEIAFGALPHGGPAAGNC